MDIRSACLLVETGLKTLHRDELFRRLNVGQQEAAVRERLAAVELSPPDALVSLYMWRNGTRTDGATLGEIDLFPGFYFLSLDDAIANRQAFITDPRWHEDWFPVFADGGGDFYFVDFGNALGRVHRFRIDEDESPAEFESTATLLATLGDCYAQSIFFLDSTGYLDMNVPRFEAMAALHNPSIRWWTQ